MERDAVRVAAMSGKGRGLVAARPIRAGALIEASPTVAFAGAACDQVEAGPLGDYYFAHPEDPEAGLLALGLVTLANHADPGNARIDWRHDPAIGWVLELRAVQDVAEGEEITHRYRCGPWFDVVS